MNDSLPFAIIRAAEIRALGGSWSAAATAAGMDLDKLKNWTRQHGQEWNRELFRVRREARDSACDEAVQMLRKQMRAEEAKTILVAANTLAKQFAERKGRRRAEQPKDVPAQFLELLNTIPDEQTTRVDLHLQAAADEAHAAEAADAGAD